MSRMFNDRKGIGRVWIGRGEWAGGQGNRAKRKGRKRKKEGKGKKEREEESG